MYYLMTTILVGSTNLLSLMNTGLGCALHGDGYDGVSADSQLHTDSQFARLEIVDFLNYTTDMHIVESGKKSQFAKYGYDCTVTGEAKNYQVKCRTKHQKVKKQISCDRVGQNLYWRAEDKSGIGLFAIIVTCA